MWPSSNGASNTMFENTCFPEPYQYVFNDAACMNTSVPGKFLYITWQNFNAWFRQVILGILLGTDVFRDLIELPNESESRPEYIDWQHFSRASDTGLPALLRIPRIEPGTFWMERMCTVTVIHPVITNWSLQIKPLLRHSYRDSKSALYS